MKELEFEVDEQEHPALVPAVCLCFDFIEIPCSSLHRTTKPRKLNNLWMQFSRIIPTSNT